MKSMVDFEYSNKTLNLEKKMKTCMIVLGMLLIMTVSFASATVINPLPGTFVAADTSITGTNPPAFWYSATPSDTDNKWSYDTTKVFSGANPLSSRGSYLENCPLIKTTETGLAQGDYDVYVVFDVGYIGSTVKINATIDPSIGQSEMPVYDYTTSIRIDDAATAFYQYLGTLEDVTSVYVRVDDGNGSFPIGPKYYGLAYEAVPEPATLILIGCGSMLMLSKKRRVV